MNDNNNEPRLQAVLRKTSRLTDEAADEVRELVLYIDDPAFRYRVGQSIAVIVPGKDDFGTSNHSRKYSIARGNVSDTEDGTEITLVVRRCFYIDEFSGEEYPGRASNYLCDVQSGESISITGPYPGSFTIPRDNNANILMLGVGTGIAPFRAFIERIYSEQKEGWKGQIRLFYGAKSGLDLLYMNDKNNDLSNYYEESTFKAYNALVDGYFAGEEQGLEKSIKSNKEEVWDLINQPNTYVFLAGLNKIADSFDSIMSEMAGSELEWKKLKQQLTEQHRWSKLLYS